MTDYRMFDRARRAASPLQLDLIESFAAGKLNRRQFVQMGAMLGMSTAMIAACGGTDSPTTGGGSATQTGISGGDTAKVKTGGSIRIAISIKPSTPLESVTMQDLAVYGLVSQVYEYLCVAGADLKLEPQLAESWEPNADASEWTFKLRQGVTWADGSPLTSADVVETMERLVAAGNSGLKGALSAGATTAPDASTVVFKLDGPFSNFPYVLSAANPQTAITPKALPPKTPIDKSKIGGTGPWKLTSYDPNTGAKFARNEKWWGGSTPMDTQEWVIFGDAQATVTALQANQVDAVVQFSLIDGEALTNDANVNVLKLRSAAHREVWMRVDEGQFTNKLVRQALGFSLDRQAIIQQLFKGNADIGNDHPIAPIYPYFDPSVPQRPRDVAKAKALLAQAGVTSIKAVIQAGENQEIPDLAQLIQQNAKEAGFDLTPNVTDNNAFYGKYWCDTSKQPPCVGNAELGIVDYGDRPSPDVYLNSALRGGGVWNSSHYASAEFDASYKDFQKAIGVDAQKTAAGKMQAILLEDSPILVPYFYNFLSAHSKKYAGITVTGLGQMNVSKAGLV